MPELKPLPCPNPKCGSTDKFCMNHVVLTDKYCITCECGCQGPHAETPSAAIAEFNSLPRALMWGEEPPKAAGWYWWRWAKYQQKVCIEVRDGLIVEHPRKQLRDADEIGGQWAGPIAPPRE